MTLPGSASFRFLKAGIGSIPAPPHWSSCCSRHSPEYCDLGRNGGARHFVTTVTLNRRRLRPVDFAEGCPKCGEVGGPRELDPDPDMIGTEVAGYSQPVVKEQYRIMARCDADGISEAQTIFAARDAPLITGFALRSVGSRRFGDQIIYRHDKAADAPAIKYAAD